MMLRKEVDSAPVDLDELSRRRLLRDYRFALRSSHKRFTERVEKGHFFCTGILFPYEANPVRRETPPELWQFLKMFDEENKIDGIIWRGQRITYVDVRVSTGFSHSSQYDQVFVRHFSFRLNKTQASIVRLLHESLLRGEYDGLVAKRLLAEVGKGSGDIGDYFKDQLLWRNLIFKVSPGRYRLNAFGFTG
jgi:hypothetical protein